jgi:hypothetical protein
MKKIFIAIGILSVAVTAAQAQVFSADMRGANEIPPNSSSSIGSGSFVLTGDSLSFSVNALLAGTLPVDAGVFGPASPTQTAPMIFDLGTPTVSLAGGNAFVSYSGVEALSPAQVSNLLSDLDYVSIASTGAGYSGGEIRGQVTLLPEPSSLLLLGLGAGLVWNARRKKA